MVEGHERFEEFALQHVLGGLSSSDAAIFRAHLVECRECRLRVAELRDMAAELAATEREERRRSAVATQVARQEGSSEESRSWLPWSSPRWALLAVVLVSAVVVALLFWNYHLRRVTDYYAGVAERQAEVLEVLGSGKPLRVEPAPGVAAIRKRQVAVDLLGLPRPTDEQVALWLLPSSDGPVWVRRLPDSGQLAFVVDVGDAHTLLVTLEPGDKRPQSPGDRILASVRIRTS